MPNFLNLLRLYRLMRMDPKRGYISVGGNRIMISPSAMIPELLEGMESVMGKGGSASALYIASKNQSKPLFEMVNKIFGEGIMDTEEGFRKVLDNFIPYLGYGRFELVKYDLEGGEFILRMRNGPTKTEAKKISEEPCCHTERGVITGIVESVLKRPCSGKEVFCQVKGDEYCEFVVTG
ncbi:MAG: 4-vinyl reductase [Halobacteriota archaeon]|nr:4-vinyl reductase [Halobacteriota archaeon]